MNQKPIITVRNLTAGFGDRLLFENINFDVHEGEIFIILGGSGCGKTTLMKHMLGLYQPLAGSIVIDGMEVVGAPEDTYASVLRRIGVMYQSGALFGSMTVAENVMLPILTYTDFDEQSARTLASIKLKLVNLEGTEDLYPSELSGGMKRRAGIARAMALNPKILFFDELSAGLDPITAADLDRLILTLNAQLGTTMVIVSHELTSIFTIAHRVIMLDKDARGIIADADPKALRDQSTNIKVRNFFNPRSKEQA